MIEKIVTQITKSINTKKDFIKDHKNLKLISVVTKKIVECYKKNKKLIIFGNGGSASDAQHFAAELVGRFKRERRALNAIAITTNTSIITALGNDYGFETIFSRQIESLAQEGDVVFGISTSGNSENVISALKLAKKLGCTTVGLTGFSGGKMKQFSDYCICVPTDDTPRIQEVHITIIHIICDLVEEFVIKNKL
jgi:D-sedoheptulose 7-phosphate isomerase